LDLLAVGTGINTGIVTVGLMGSDAHVYNYTVFGRDVNVGGRAIVLARRECATLEHLMRRLGRVVPKTILEEKLYGIDDDLGSNVIPVHVHHLRRKLVEAGATAEIHTVRGVGYLLDERKP